MICRLSPTLWTCIVLGFGIQFPTNSVAQVSEFHWVGPAGAQDWTIDSNWSEPGVPNASTALASFATDLDGDLNADLGPSDITLAGLLLGGTSGPVATEISSSGGTLIFHNTVTGTLGNADFSNNGIVDGSDFLIWQRGLSMIDQLDNRNGDADGSGVVDGIDLGIWQENYGTTDLGIGSGRPLIYTGTTAGSINRISANVHLLNENLVVRGATDLEVSGNVTIQDDTPPVEPATEISASFNVGPASMTATINGNLDTTNQFDGLGGELGLNTLGNSRGSIVVNGVISGPGDLNIGGTDDASVRLNAMNTYTGSTFLGETNVELGSDQAFGTGRITTHFVRLSAVGADRVISNNILLSRGPIFEGEHNITLSGEITQTNNEQLTNNLPEGRELIVDGTIAIWGDLDTDPTRVFTFDGTGKSRVTGSITDLSQQAMDEGAEIQDTRIRMTGSGVLIIDVAEGENNHIGPTVIENGNFHYVNNGSLNAGVGNISSRGGAIGVDTGVAHNTVFNDRISPGSYGGLMLAPSDVAETLDFTSTLDNAANMTVAAPETGMNFTGTIIPANGTYALGGGSGTLTLPNAQLTGENSLDIRNGGKVELFGDNTYTGRTKILARQSTILAVDSIADGGIASSLGASTSDAANIEIQGGTLQYIGSGSTTDRLFTVGTAGATIDSSGTGALVFTNTAALGMKDAGDLVGDVDDFTGTNNPNVVYNVQGDSSDVVPGMTISDPDPAMGFDFTQAPCNPDGSNCIPDGTVVTGVSLGGGSIGLSNDYPFVSKLGTRLVFGTVPRTLTLTGSNTDDNVLAAAIGNSSNGGVVNLTKEGTGNWVLTGNNTYTGGTTVEEGTLTLTDSYLDDSSTVNLLPDGILELDFSGADVIGALMVGGVELADGIYGATDGGMGYHVLPQLAGSGFLNVGGVAFAISGGLVAIPEPSTLVLTSLAIVGLSYWSARSRRSSGR